MNKKIVEFANSSLVNMFRSIRCGFELEAQEVNGERSANYEESDESECDCTQFEDCECDLSTREGGFEEYVYSQIPIPREMQWCEDGSVGAGEFKTIGPRTVPEFLRCAKLIFDQVNRSMIVTDEECSFHIHMSIPGISHGFSKQFQKSLIEGVIKNSALLPDSVLSRWQVPP